MTSTIDQQFVEYIVKSLVSNPEAVEVKRTVDDKGVLLELTVDPEDLGRVIGKRGATAQSLRTLLRALGTKNESRFNLKIIDNGPERPERPERTERNQDDRQDSKSASKPASKSQEKSETSPEPADEPQTAEPEAPAPQDEPEETATQMAEDDTSSLLSKTRKELEEFDDLDL